MKVTVTEKLKLNGVTEDIDSEFTRLCKLFASACDEVSRYAFKHGLTDNHKALNDELYYGIRYCFNMKSQLTQSVIKTVIAKYKTEQTKLENEYHVVTDGEETYRFRKNLTWMTSPIRFLNPQADLVRNRDFSFLEHGGTVSVATLNGRVKLSYSVRKKSRLFREPWKIGGAKLIKHHNGDWYLHVSLTKEVPEAELKDVKEVVGIDRGLVNIITTRDSRNTAYENGDKVRDIRSRYDRTRASLQKKGTKGAKRVLKRISGRENRWMENVNHSISKALVRKYGSDTLFVFEDLSGISFDKSRLGNRTAEGRHELRSWSFYSLEQKLIYKARQCGSMAIKVNPKYTSQRCPACGNIDKESRHHEQHQYICVKCGCTFNDDEVAGYNLRTLGILYLAGDEDPHFTKTASVKKKTEKQEKKNSRPA